LYICGGTAPTPAPPGSPGFSARPRIGQTGWMDIRIDIWMDR
jgi:hypothetical protein